MDTLECEKRSKRVYSEPVVHKAQSEDSPEASLSQSMLPALSPLKLLVEPTRPPAKSLLLHSFQRKLTHPDEDVDLDQFLESDKLPDMQRLPSLSQTEVYTQHIEPGFQRIYVDNPSDDSIRKQTFTQEFVRSCKLVFDLINIRDKYIFYDEWNQPNPLVNSYKGIAPHAEIPALADEGLDARLVDGVFQVFDVGGERIDCGVINSTEFYKDLKIVLFAMHNVELKSFAHMRLETLTKKFELHLIYNQDREIIDQKLVPHRDFYNIRKIDNHVHLSAAMNQKHLLKFIKKKLRTEPDQVVVMRGEEPKTLQKVFEELHITSYELSVDSLNCNADHTTFHRFDRFNSKYNPMGLPILREIFLKTDNFINGRYFAELTKEVIEMLEREKYQLAEYRVSVYGRSYNEWQILSQWFIEFNLKSKSVGWLIQIPRIFKVYRSLGAVASFEDMIKNIFGPMFEATLHPGAFPVIFQVLQQIVGFDSVDDESVLEKVTSFQNYKEVKPRDWVATDNPPYSYWSYYIYANLFVLNQLRRARGLNTFAFRPHCGEAGSHDHLACAFLTAHSVNHGIELHNNPVLQYMFYIQQVGLSMSPLSNNKLFLKYEKNPFPIFLKRGLNVALSTDDPLMIHLTKEPLLEEYSVAAQVYKLSQVDLCEIVRNSILQSGFSNESKKTWLGSTFAEGTPESNGTGLHRHRKNQSLSHPAYLQIRNLPPGDAVPEAVCRCGVGRYELIVLETNMGCLFLVWMLGTATALGTTQVQSRLEIDLAIPEDQYAVGYDCNSARLAYIQVVCELCDAEVAYALFHGETSYLTGIYPEEQAMLASALEDVQVRLPIANYSVAYSGQDICISAYEFMGRPNFQLLFSYFSQVPSQEIQVPELFWLRGKTDLDFIAVTTRNTSGEYQYNDLRVSYRADDAVDIGNNNELGLERMEIAVEGTEASVSYTGMAQIQGGQYPFALVTRYDRTARSPFSLTINPLNNFTAQAWTQAIDPLSNCANTVPVPGLSSVSQQNVTAVNLVFAYRPENMAATLLRSVSFFSVLDFAVMPLVNLTGVTGQNDIDFSDHSCALVLAGTANYTYDLRLQVIASTSQWYVSGGIDAESVSISDIESSFYTDFFLGVGQSILPVYSNSSNSNYIAYFRGIQINRFLLRFQTAPNLYMSIAGYSTWGSNTDTLTQVLVGWAADLVESVIVLSISGRSDFVSGDNGITVVDSLVVASTGNIDLTQYPLMRGVGNRNVAQWNLGMYGTATLAPGAACDQSEFCSVLVSNSAAFAQFSLQGNILSDQLNLRTPFPNIALAANLTLSEAELVLDVLESGTVLHVEGAFELQAEENSVIRFAGNLTDEGGSAVLEVRSEVPWDSPMGMDRLQIGTLVARGFLNRTTGLSDSSIRGPVILGSNCSSIFTPQNCILGTIDVSFSPANYTFNSYAVRVSNLSLIQFMQIIVGFDIDSEADLPFALSGLSVEYSLDIVFSGASGSPGILIRGPIVYFGVSGWMDASMDRLGDGIIYINMTLDEFFLGNFNLLARRTAAGVLSVTMTADGNDQDTQALLQGRVLFWDIDVPLRMTINDVGLTAEFTGSTGLNLYNLDFQLRAEDFLSFASANVTFLGVISTDQLESAEEDVRDDLLYWIRQGTDALDTIDMWRDNATTMRAAGQSLVCPEDFCPEEVNCVSPPVSTCMLYSQGQSCAQNKTSCSSVSFNCSRSTTTCVSSQARCITIDNGACIDWITTCDTSIDVCLEWTEVCGDLEELSCGTYQVAPNPDDCLEYEMLCNQSIYIDPGCLYRCESNGAIAETLYGLENTYRTGYTSAASSIQGFETMAQQLSSEMYRSDLFSIISLQFVSELSEPGLSITDFDYQVTFTTFSAQNYTTMVDTQSVRWSFVARELNEVSLFRAAKTALINNSNGTLSSRLVTRTALEVVLEDMGN